MKKQILLYILAFYSGRAVAQSGSTNADFESSSAGQVTSSTQVQGWTITNGTHYGNSASNTCSLTSCCPGTPSLSSVITHSPGGAYIDPQIGVVYPISSVFGSGSPNFNAMGSNPSIGTMKGTTFFRLNDAGSGHYGIERISRSIQVTSTNYEIDIALMSVMYPGHVCCDAPMANIFINGNSCPQFNNYACQSGTPTGFYQVGSGLPPPSPSNFNPVFSKWKIFPIDLTQYVGQTVRVDIVASHCNQGGHFGYAYVDAYMDGPYILVNGQPVILPATGGTVYTCAPSVSISAPYFQRDDHVWTAPSGYTTTQLVVAGNIGDTFTLSMPNTGICTATTKTIYVASSQPALNIASSNPVPCPGEPVTLSASGLATYTWNTGDTTSAITISPKTTTVIYVNGTHQSGCPSQASITIYVGAAPPLFVSSSAPALCLGDSATLLAFGANSFTWSTGANAPSIIVSPVNTTPYFVTGSNGGCTTTSSLTQVVQNCTGIKDQFSPGEVKIYPNPAGDYLNVESDRPGALRLFNQLGSLVYKERIGPGINKIKLDQLRQGVYLAEITLAGETRIVKVVKE
jgi:hypothetical protein